jgi:UDP-glucuronate 4-epimerase
LRALVTGGAGAIGSFVVEALLARGDEVAVIDCFHDFYPRGVKERNLARARAHAGFAGLYETDIRDEAGIERAFARFAPQGVVHLAARAGVGPSLSDPVGYADVNLRGTAVVLNAAAAARVERFVFASSSSVYGERPRGAFREDDETDRPISPYAATKRGGELLCHAAHAATGLAIQCVRFFTVYGPRQRPDLAIHKFARCMAADRPIPLMGDGSAERDFTFVADTVDGVVRALDRASGFRIYNLGRGKPVTMNETVAALERALGRKAVRQELPPMAGNVPRTWASIERARAELAYEPKVDLDEGLAAFARWLREEGECAFS